MIAWLEVLVGGRDLDIRSELQGFVYREPLEGFATFTLHVVSSDWSKWDVFITNPEDTSIKIRWIVTDGSKTSRSAWRKVRVEQAKYSYVVGGIEVWLYGFDAGIKLIERCHSNAFNDMRISEMVELIAGQNGLDSRIRPTLDTYSAYQCNMDDSTFIRSVLQPLAVDSGKYGGYNFYIENGNMLIFEPPSLESSQALGTFTVANSKMRGTDHVTNVLEVNFSRARQILDGHRSVEMRGFDTVQKVPASWIANDGTVPFKKLASTLPQVPDIPAQIVPLASPNHGRTPPAGLEHAGIALCSKKARSLFRTQVMVSPLVTENVLGKTVNLVVRDVDGKLHHTTGKWYVEAVQQAINATGPKPAVSTLELARRAYHK